MLATLFLTLSILPFPGEETEVVVSDTLSEAVAVTSFKQTLPLDKVASPVSTVYLKEMESRGLKNPKDFSSLIPNLHIPDYGSAMTSTIYMRGFGSRIDNPVVALYIDDVPVLNKNSYDMEMYDIRRADVIRGPQGTLYGRNSLCGVVALSTVSPLSWQGIRAGVEYGSENTVSARASVYGKSSGGFAAGVALNYRHSDGFYTNAYTGEKCDPYDALSLRFMAGKEFGETFRIENILSASGLDQGGYAYRLYDEASGVLAPVSYNDTCSYRRLNVTEALKMRYRTGSFSLGSVTSWQFLMDRMTLDQDFTPQSMFTMIQAQKEHSVTQEFILKPEAPWRKSWWNWQTGLYGFYRHNGMSAPVTMKKDGIDQLILGSMPSMIRDMFVLKEESFPIESDFILQTYGAALYHESYFTVGKWLFTAGLRVDYEGNSMDYDSRAEVNYKLNLPMMKDFRNVKTVYAGKTCNDYVEFLPKVSVQYSLGDMAGNGGMRLFATVAKGYKAGGFNTQIFSNILQNMMMSDIMEDAVGAVGGNPSMMPSIGGTEVTADNTSYLPETSYDYEVGTDFSFDLPGNGHSISGSAAVFYIDCRNQQITVFPDGNSTGRMMANAGRSRSAGVELQASYRVGGFSVTGVYGFTDARFIEFNDGQEDYGGNMIPYSPSHTLNLRLSYRFGFRSDILRSLTVSADMNGVGRIWWDEANTLSQPFYVLPGADIRLGFRWFDFFLRGDNLSCTDYDVFYFRSVGNSFFQKGKPVRFNAGFSFEF